MEIIRSLEDPRFPLHHTILTIGNFDGVHLGHQEIFRHVVATARKVQGRPAVMTFVPHPLEVLAPQRAPRRLTTQDEKEALIAEAGIDLLLSIPFTAAVARMEAKRFVEDILVRQLGVRFLVVGQDYRFGRQRTGDSAALVRWGEEMGFTTHILEPVQHDGRTYSSTRIRELVASGEVEEAAAFLGRDFQLAGTVRSGFQRGRQLGFPTANLEPDHKILPGCGVYAVRVEFRGQSHEGVANIGSNPTFSGQKLSVEVHILDFAQNIYGERLIVRFIKRLRDEKLFPSPEALHAAIEQDVLQARALLHHTQKENCRS